VGIGTRSLLGVALLAAVAGGAETGAKAPGAAQPVAETTSVSTPTTAAGSPRPASPSAARASATTNAGCPVTIETLLAAVRKNSGIYDNLAQPVGLEKPVCYHGYATARTTPVPNVDAATILFSYNAGTKAWAALNFGSSGVCTGKVPADVASHLPECTG
jgi:hypothetical protein